MNSNFENYLNTLSEEQSSKSLLKLLGSIRNEVDWPKNRYNINEIRERGCLKRIIYILQSQQHKHILDVCLSILGNCVMDRNCAREAVGIYNILSAINHVLKRFPKEDSISGRSFRILGNLCHHKVDWAGLIIDRKPQIVKHLTEILISSSSESSETKVKYSEATVLMAIRCLRYLVNQYTVKQLMKTFPVLNAVGSLLIKASQEWQTNQTNENVLNSIITLLNNLSRYKDYNMIVDLKNTTKGDALDELANILLLCPKKVIKIIMNFIRISKLKSDLPVPNIFNKFIGEVLKKNIDTEDFKTECLDYIQCLCYLLDHPANRNSHQCIKSIPLLINVLKILNAPTDEQLKCCIILVNTLNKCQFEEALIQEQIKCNILDVIIKKLEILVDDSEIINSKHVFKKGQKRKFPTLIRRLEFGGGDTEKYHEGYGKRKVCSCGDCLDKNASYNCMLLHSSSFNSSSPQSPSISEENYFQRQLSPQSSDDDHFSYFSKLDRSPSPCSSSGSDYASYSWASPCSSPRSVTNEVSYSDSDDYSPVCSEADSTEFPMTATIEVEKEDEGEDDRQSECAEVEENVQFDESLEGSSIATLKMKLISEICKLIKTYIKMKPPILQLGSENLLLALLNCSELFNTKQPIYITSVNIVSEILHTHVYLIPLMKTKFIEKVYRLTEFIHTSHCVICVDHSCIGNMVLRQLKSLAEGAAGKGDIAHQLLRGSIDIKRQLVLVIPYIVENKTILAKFLLNCGGLNILMQLLKEDPENKNRAIKVLCELASKKLDIANPKKVAIDVDDKIRFNALHSDVPVNLVTFKLDDGKSVKADRDILTEKSEYFERLLNGHFKESNEDEVYLHNVRYKTLHCLLKLLDCVNMLEKTDIDTLLDVIALSDRYLMSDICCYVTNYVEKYKISSKTVPVIYRWSLESGLNLLRIESVAFALVANIVDKMRYHMFNDLFNLGYSDELLEDIQKLLVRYLS